VGRTKCIADAERAAATRVYFLLKSTHCSAVYQDDAGLLLLLLVVVVVVVMIWRCKVQHQ